MCDIFRKHKRAVLLAVLALLLILINVFVYNDAELYATPIVKIVSVSTERLDDVSGSTGISEARYRQTLDCVHCNGTEKGRSAVLTNTFSYSHMSDREYHKGDFIFLNKDIQDGELDTTTSDNDQKRDYFVSAMFSALLWGAAAVAGKRGFAFIAALLIDSVLLIAGFVCSAHGISFIAATAVLMLAFSAISLILCMGRSRNTRLVFAETLISAVILTVIYCGVSLLAPAVDFTLQDYIRSAKIDPEIFFTCGALIGSLGAIMDVAASINSGCSEIIKKDPAIDAKRLAQSLDRIGTDVMGTMINVLFYTYLVGAIPVIMLRLANGMNIYNTMRYYFPYEILRFLAGASGIAVCTRVSRIMAVKACSPEKQEEGRT